MVCNKRCAHIHSLLREAQRFAATPGNWVSNIIITSLCLGKSEREGARARVSHLPRGIGANVRARAATDKLPPSQAAPLCRRCTPHLTRSPPAHLLLLCALSHYNGSQLPFTASKLGARAARPVCRSPLMWLLLPAPLCSAPFRSSYCQPASSACLVCPSSVPPAACRIISHFPGAPPAPLLSPFVVVLVLILLAACRMPLASLPQTRNHRYIYDYICIMYLCTCSSLCFVLPPKF